MTAHLEYHHNAALVKLLYSKMSGRGDS